MSPDRLTIEVLLANEPLVRGLARSILQGDDRVEDVVQDTWSTALTHEPRDPNALSRWLGTIARRLALRVRNDDRSREVRERRDRPPRGLPTPDEVVEREETRKRVLDALLALAPKHRDILLLRFYEDLRPREIAKQLDVPVETVRTRVKRAVAALRAKLTRRYGSVGRSLPLALVFLAKEPTKATVLPWIGLKGMAVAGLFVAAGLVAVMTSGGATKPEPTPVKPPEPEYAATPLPPAADEPPPPVEPSTIEKSPGSNSDQGFPDMARIPAGPFTMGLDEKTLRELEKPFLRGNNDTDVFWLWALRSEGPAHQATTEEYLIDRYSVTNAEYRAFLDDACRRTVFIRGKLRTITAVAEDLFGEHADRWHAESIYWLNAVRLTSVSEAVFRQNAGVAKAVLDEFNEGRPRPARIGKLDALPDRLRTSAWVDFTLPEGLALTVYSRIVPDHWARAVPEQDQLEQPVVFVSAIDAVAYAEWAGMHLPTEEEWEKAARGPNGYLYPWGPTWNPATQKNLLLWFGADIPPAPRYRDRPIDVRSLPAGASPYGLHHMLGNVYEWTSSVPALYPKSRARRLPWLGNRSYRVLRSMSYGSTEKTIRNTHRAMTMVDAGVSAMSRMQAVGFRCAKYPQPARDFLTARLQRGREDGRLPVSPTFETRRIVGIERHALEVPGKSIAIGFAPVRDLPETDPRSEKTVILGFLCWNANAGLVLPGRDDPHPAPESGYFICLRKGQVVLARPTAEGPVVVAPIPGGEFMAGDLPAPAQSATVEKDVLRLQVVFRNERFSRVLQLPLTFKGPDLPNESWRR